MKEYFVVWEAYSEEWKLKEKGYHFFSIETNDHLMNRFAEFCENMADARNIDINRFTITSVQPI